MDNAMYETPPTPTPINPEKTKRRRCFRRIRIGSTETPISPGDEGVRVSSDFDSGGCILFYIGPKR
jgi:hypothetical protein